MSLDHGRMKMPRIRKLRLYTLRGRDDEAEGGVLPAGRSRRSFI
jgi:hypothetical protein